jgi:hypothetical protein
MAGLAAYPTSTDIDVNEMAETWRLTREAVAAVQASVLALEARIGRSNRLVAESRDALDRAPAPTRSA